MLRAQFVSGVRLSSPVLPTRHGLTKPLKAEFLKVDPAATCGSMCRGIRRRRLPPSHPELAAAL